MKLTKKLFQWDINQSVTECKGIYVDYMIDGEVYRVRTEEGVNHIPDEFLQSSGMKTVYEAYADGTICNHTLTVIGRPMPPDYVFTPTQKETFDSLIAKVDEAVADMQRRADSGEFDGKDGADGKDGKDGLNGRDGADGRDGYTPVRGIDYMTPSDIQNMEEAVSSGATGTFNQNVTEKTNAFNQNVEQKTSQFDSNALQKTTDFNENADEKMREFDERVELNKFPDVTIVGSPTISHGNISGFSSANYCRFPFMVDFKNKPFEITFDIVTGQNVTNQENILDSDFGLAFAIRNARFVIAISTNGTSWDLGEGVGTMTVQPSTSYRIVIGWNGTQYTVKVSTDGGQTFVTDITKSGTVQPYPRQIFIGVGENFGVIANAFSGIINLNYASLYIDGQLAWLGIDVVGLATRLATDLSNIDEDGIIELNRFIDERTADYKESNDKYQAEQDRRLTNLEYASRGVLYREESSEDEAYIKDIPSDAMPYAVLDKIGGKSIVWNQFVSSSKYAVTTKNVSVVMDKCVVTFNGTPSSIGELVMFTNTYPSVKNHYFYYRVSGSDIVTIQTNINGSYYNYRNQIVQITSETAMSTVIPTIQGRYISVGTEVNERATISVADLTVWFGTGNEPTSVDDPRIAMIEDYLEKHPEYQEPTILSANVKSVDSVGVNGEPIESKPISLIVQKYFPQGMKSAGTVHDYIDVENGVAVKNVGDVDLGTLGFNRYADMTHSIFYANVFGMKSTIAKALCEKYNWVGWRGVGDSNFVQGIIQTHPSLSIVYIDDDNYTDITTFRQAMQGVMFYHELTTPTITPIDAEDLEVLRTLHLEGGGTLTFAQDDIHLPVPNKESWLVKTGGNA